MSDTATNTVEQHLLSLARNFQQALEGCPPELSGRQRVLTREHGGYLWLEIRTTFRVPIAVSSNGNGNWRSQSD